MKKVIPTDADGQISRVARRFGLVAAAGELASEYGLTGWQSGEAIRAAESCFESWLEGFGGKGNREDRMLLAQVRAFLEAHGSSRFESMKPDLYTQRVANRVGFYQDEDKGREYLVMREAFLNELCKGYTEKTAKTVLIQAGMLIPDTKTKQPTQSKRLPGIGQERVFVIRHHKNTDET